MSSLARAIAFTAACLLAAALYAIFANAVVEMYPAAQAAETAQRLAREQTARVQAEQWGATVRGWAWPAAGIAVLIVVAVQTGRTLRHRESERTRRTTLLMLYARQMLPPGAQVEVLPYRGDLALADHDAGEIIPYAVAARDLARTGFNEF